MKKTLALVLALAMVFSTITVAFAEGTLSAEAQIVANLGMLKGETGTVDAAYTATAPTRLQSAVMFLRLKGLETEALAYTGEANFADGNIAWAEGSNLLAYLKANPQLGWAGDGTNFNPNNTITAKEYYKVLLEALGYKQTVTGVVVGDFTWDNVLEFAALKGLSKVATVTNYTVNDLAIATVEALKLNVKDTEAALYKSLVTEEAAVAAGLVEAAATTAVAVKSAKATGNAVVEVTFAEAVDAAAENVANYAIEGLTVNSAAISAEKTVILGTDAMTVGKIYNLTVGEKTVKFTGIAKVSGSPSISDVKSADIEEVVITFDKKIDLASGSDVANYTIAGVEIVSAEVDEATVTLTTVGLKNRTSYTVKIANIKSVDGVNKKSASDTFKTNFDLTAPKISGLVEVRTNEKIVVNFTEEVTLESAEDLANYSIKVNETDGAELEIVSVTLDADDEDFVTIVTEPMEKNEEYKISVNGLVDQTKSANTMTRTSTATYKAKGVDETAPSFDAASALSPTSILATFKDASDLDEASLLDISNYTLGDLAVEDAVILDDDYAAGYYVYRVVLTVEEMNTGTSYTLKAVDILDEFGNEMTEKSKIVSTAISEFDSSKLQTALATAENKILLTFSEEVDEASAENIANYTVTNDIGTPIKATLLTATTVELEVNKLKNGGAPGPDDRLYQVTANGVTDLAGNVLNYKVEVDTWTNTWDTTAPEIEGVEVANIKVVSLTFDEKVQYAADAQLWLAKNGNAAAIEPLDVKDISDDKTVVEFSGADLDEDVSYTVYKIVYGVANNDGGIRDLNGKPLYVDGIEFNEYVFQGKENAVDKAQVDSIEQVNGTTFEVVMSRDVVVSGPASKATLNSKGNFTVTRDADDHKLLTFVKDAGKIEKGVEYDFDFDAFIADKHGVVVENADTDKTVLTGDYTDADAPTVDEVVASDRKTITVTFDEDIDTVAAGAFTLKNVDTEKTVTLQAVVPGDIDGNEVTINLSALTTVALESRYEYVLTIDMTKIDDMAGNAGTDTAAEYYFVGTNLAE